MKLILESIFNFVGWAMENAEERKELLEQRVTASNAKCASGAKCPSRVSVDGVEVGPGRLGSRRNTWEQDIHM